MRYIDASHAAVAAQEAAERFQDKAYRRSSPERTELVVIVPEAMWQRAQERIKRKPREPVAAREPVRAREPRKARAMPTACSHGIDDVLGYLVRF